MQTSGRPLADPLGVLFAQTQADLLQTRQESAAEPIIRGGLAADLPQVRGGAVDFLVSKKTEKFRQSAKRVQISLPWTFFRFWRTIFSAADYFVRPGFLRPRRTL